MKTKLLYVLAFASLILLCTRCEYKTFETPLLEPEEEEKAPFDWLYNQRAYPNNYIDITAYRQAVRQVKTAQKENANRSDYQWELAGPINIGGRITDVALHPTNQDIIYAGASVGGVWKSEDKGATWLPIFDGEGALSIGNIAVAESNPDVLYVGTGEANGSATSGAFFGDGVYKSIDAGDTWEHIGLENSQHVGRIAVDPTNENRVFVAAAGLLYGKSEDKGLYRSNDGGDSWEKVLFISDSTSIIDVAMDYWSPNIVYAAAWERIRRPWQRSYGGITSGIWRSMDGGDTWEELTNGLPWDNPDIGRIGLATSKSAPFTVYASYTTNPITNVFEGVYKTTDGGDFWQKVDNDPNVNGVFASFGWFFGNVRIDPNNAENVFVLGQVLVQSADGGENYFEIDGNNHVDNHGLEIHPENSDFMVSGNDGGIYITEDGAQTWTHVKTLPITQFYEAEIDPSVPYRIYGGTQDNGSMGTWSGDTGDWQRFLGGDGFHVLVNPLDNNFMFAEYQWGNLFRSENNGNSFQFIFNGADDDRTNWNTPVVFDPNDPFTLYYGANRLYRSADNGTNWEAISPDLTDGQHPSGSLAFGTITTVAVAPSNSDVIYVGTDDGNIQKSTIGGLSWENISNGIPDRYVTQITVDPEDENLVYATLSGYRNVDYQPHVLKSTNGGGTWEDISGDLPEIPMNDFIIDVDFEETFYVACDLGVFYTINGGENWEILGEGLPLTVVNDLVWNQETRTLVAATFGRSIQKLDLNDFTNVSENNSLTDNQMSVFPNPATVNANARVRLDVPMASNGDLELFDVSGKKVKTLKSGAFAAGKQEVAFTLEGIAKGQYFIRFASNQKILTKKFIVQ